MASSPPGAKDCCAKDPVGLGIYRDLLSPWVSPFSIARATWLIGREALSSFRQLARACASVRPMRPSGGSM